MYSTNELKKGLIIDFEGAPHVVETVQVSAPTARGASTITRVRLRNLKTRQKVDKSFRGSEMFGEGDFERRPCQLLYEQQGTYHFMDTQSYEQFFFEKADLEWESKFLRDEMDGIVAFKSGEEIFAIELPNTVSLKVEDAPPAIKGATASARTKPATLETGLVVQVPEHIRPGEMLNVDTRTGEFLGRTQT
jgi:elongation factor P